MSHPEYIGKDLVRFIDNLVTNLKTGPDMSKVALLIHDVFIRVDEKRDYVFKAGPENVVILLIPVISKLLTAEVCI